MAKVNDPKSLERLTACEARDALTADEITSEDLVRAYIGRIAERDGDVRAWAHFDAEAALDDAHRALLKYVTKVTEAAYRTTPEDVQSLRDHSWTEPQIAEAVYITALFAFFNRVADAFGIAPQGYLEMNKTTG